MGVLVEGLRIVEAVGGDIELKKTGEQQAGVGSNTQGLADILDSLVKLARLCSEYAKSQVRTKILRIGLHPSLARGAYVLHVSLHKIIEGFDAKTFPLARVVSQLKCFVLIFLRSFILIHNPVHEAQVLISNSEVGVQFDGTFIEWKRRRVVSSHMQFPALRVSFECFE